MSRGLLIAGHLESAAQRSLMRTASHIGDVLLATGSRWEVRRSGAAPGDPDVRAELRRWRDHLSGRDDLMLVAAVGRVVTTHAGLALVTAAEHESSGEAPLALSEIRDGVRAAGLGPAVIVLGGWSDAGSEHALGVAWLAELATDRPGDLIAVGAAAAAPAIVEALLEALVGRATDPTSGTVTLRSLGDYLARSVPGAVVQRSSASQTVVEPMPLAGAWDPRLTRRSQLATEPETDRPLAEPDDLTGVVLPGRFRVDAMMARGGFGAIYRARQLAIERDVAVKVLHTTVDPASPSGRLFVHEIQSVGRIDHPNVVKIHQADVTPGGRLFFAMELLAGRDLERVIQDDGTLAAPRAVALTCQLLAGLGAAHEVGLVHADVKPANVLVVPGRDGERVVLVDFGLSRLRPVDQPARSLGGTPAYMAPEQLRNARVDARSDLFSAALVLVTLLTGWRRQSIDALAPSLDDLPDEALRTVLRQALAIDPADRFQTAIELADALAGREHVPPSTRPARLPFGPAAFTELDADRLQGREHEIAELLAQVLYQRTVVLTGPAAIGKTSLLRAGLIPRLAAHGMEVVFATGTASAAQLLARISSARSDADRIVVVVDALDDAAAANELLSAAAVGMRGVSVVVCVRDDVHAAVASRRPDVAVVKLGPLDREGARAAIMVPLAERRLALEPALLARLLAVLETSGPAPPGIDPVQLQRVGAALYEAWPAGEATLTLAGYDSLDDVAITELPAAPRPPGQRPRRARWVAALGLAVVAVAVGWHVLGDDTTVTTPRATVIVGGSGTVLFGFLLPLREFIEDRSATSIPILSQYDLGSGGAMRTLQSGDIDLAALSTRFDRSVPVDLVTAGKILIEVPVGYDETALFVRRDNPLRRIDVAAVRAHLCCDRGQEQPTTTWKDLGLSTPPFASRPVGWTLFGRDRPPAPRDSTSATLLQADGWLCGARQLCASSRAASTDVAAHEVLSELATDADFLALSSRAFSTDRVVALVTVDHVRQARLDGRKVLWLYFAVAPGAAIPARLCRFFNAILDPSLAGRLAQLGKVEGLPHAARKRQRRALGLDDGSCAWQPIGARRDAGTLDHGVVRSPIAAALEIADRWVADPPR
jgi:hypothetical protein